MTFDLAKAITDAKPVLTVTLPQGDYPVTVLRGVNPPTVVKIVGPGARFAGFQLVGCSNLAFEVDVLQPPVAQGSPAIKLQDCKGVTFTGGRLAGSKDPATGLYMGKAAQVLGGSGCGFFGVEVAGFFKGLNCAASDDFTITGSDLHDIRTSPIDGFGQRMTLTDNHIHGIIPSGVDHSDGIHIFTKGKTVPCDGLKITGNLLELADASGTLGINLEGTSASHFTNVKVNGNTLRWNNNQGITTDWVESGEFKANVLVPLPGLDDPKHAPGIVFRNSGPGLIVEGNSVKLGPSMKPFPNNTFWSVAQTKAMGASVD